MIASVCCSAQGKEEREEKKYVIGVLTKSRDSEYWLSVNSGMEKAAYDRGVELIILSPDSEKNSKLQERMFEDLLKKGVDAIAIAPINSKKGESLKQESRGQPKKKSMANKPPN